MSEAVEPPTAAMLDGTKKNASFAVMSGVVLIIMGTLALLSPLVAGLSITIFVGVLLTIGGIVRCILAFDAGAFGRRILTFVGGILMTIAGLYMMSQPVAGLASITLILVAYLVVAGLLEVVAAFQIRPAEGWGWELFNGIVTLLLGLMLWRQFPLSGAWAVGILFGIKMIFNGWALVFIGRMAKRAARSAKLAIQIESSSNRW